MFIKIIHTFIFMLPICGVVGALYLAFYVANTDVDRMLNINGVEKVTPLSKYKFEIHVSKMFDLDEVKSEIESMYAYDIDNKIIFRDTERVSTSNILIGETNFALTIDGGISFNGYVLRNRRQNSNGGDMILYNPSTGGVGVGIGL